jgi:hypothetical protein
VPGASGFVGSRTGAPAVPVGRIRSRSGLGGRLSGYRHRRAALAGKRQPEPHLTLSGSIPGLESTLGKGSTPAFLSFDPARDLGWNDEGGKTMRRQLTKLALFGTTAGIVLTAVVVGSGVASAAGNSDIRVHININVRGDSFAKVCAHTVTQHGTSEEFTTDRRLLGTSFVDCESRTVKLESFATAREDGKTTVDIEMSSVDRPFDPTVTRTVVVEQDGELARYDQSLDPDANSNDPESLYPSAFGHFVVSDHPAS